MGISSLCSVAEAQSVHFSGAQTPIPTSTLNYPTGVAVDSSGNVYVGNSGFGTVLKETLANGLYSESSIGSDLFYPTAIAIDAHGNVYIADSDNRRVLEETLSGGTYTQTVIASGLGGPFGVAVDASGNVYIADTGNTQVVKETLSGGTYTASTIATGSVFSGVAVDGSGNVYISDQQGKQVLKETYSGGTYTQSVVASGLGYPAEIAVDQHGNLFIADINFSSNGVVWEESPSGSGYTQSQVFTSAIGPSGIAVDSNDNLYVTNIYTDQVVKLHLGGVNFYQVSVGTISQSIPLSFTFDAQGTIAAPQVLMQGTAGLDFKDDGTGTCTTNGTSHVYNIGDACTVNVTFTPKYSGPRYGAVELGDSHGNIIVTVYVQGTGVGPQVGFPPGNLSTLSIANLTSTLNAIAADGQGNLYIAENIAPHNKSSMVVKETWNGGGYTQSTVMSGLDQPLAVAVDGAGKVYIADISSYQPYVATPTANGYITNSLGAPSSGFRISALAVDGGGNVYFSDELNGIQKATYQGVAAYTTTVIDANNSTTGLATDSAGNLYIGGTTSISSPGSYQYGIFKDSLNSGVYTQSTITSTETAGISLDGNANVYAYDPANGMLLKETLSGGTYTESTLSFPMLGRGLTLDPLGNIYAPGTQATISKLDVSDAPILSFATTAAGSTSSDSPQTVTVLNSGNAILSFPVPSDGTNPNISANFTLDSSAGSECPLANAGGSTAGTLYAGASCELSISFEPAFGGPLTGSLVLTDNALNQTTPNYATQTISLNGSGIHGPAEITWPTPSAITWGTALTSAQLDAKANVAGTFSYSPAAGTVLGVGTQTLTVSFTPTDTADYESTTATVSLQVNKSTPASSLTSSAFSSFVSNSVTFTATLTSPAGTPTGTMSFYDGTTLLGGAAMSNGVAAYATSGLTAGDHSITAAYSGDTNFAAVMSVPFTEVIEDFTFTGQGSGTASPRGAAVYPLLVSAPSGESLPQQINLSVTGLPSGATATFSPSTILPGSGAVNVTLTVSVSNSAAMRSPRNPFGSDALPVALGLILLPIITDLRKSSRFGRITCLTLLAIGSIVLVGLGGCGGNGSVGGKTGTPSTPQPQNYTLTVTATSGSLSHTVTLNLTVVN